MNDKNYVLGPGGTMIDKSFILRPWCYNEWQNYILGPCGKTLL